MSTQKFWAVWRIDGGSPPHKRHDTLEAAKAEAERLAMNQSSEYYVLESIGIVKRADAPMVWESFK